MFSNANVFLSSTPHKDIRFTRQAQAPSVSLLLHLVSFLDDHGEKIELHRGLLSAKIKTETLEDQEHENGLEPVQPLSVLSIL